MSASGARGSPLARSACTSRRRFFSTHWAVAAARWLIEVWPRSDLVSPGASASPTTSSTWNPYLRVVEPQRRAARANVALAQLREDRVERSFAGFQLVFVLNRCAFRAFASAAARAHSASETRCASARIRLASATIQARPADHLPAVDEDMLDVAPAAIVNQRPERIEQRGEVRTAEVEHHAVREIARPQVVPARGRARAPRRPRRSPSRTRRVAATGPRPIQSARARSQAPSASPRPCPASGCRCRVRCAHRPA